MKTRLILLLILTATFELPAQNGKVVKGNKYKGAIFASDYQMPYTSDPPSELRFTPTPEEVAKLERQLKKEIRSINKNKPNQGKHYGPVIHRNLNKYVRQYIGIITPKGDRVVCVNFIWNSLNVFERIKGYSLWAEDFKEEWLVIHDGGSKYWQINYNLNTSEFGNFYVNGVA